MIKDWLHECEDQTGYATKPGAWVCYADEVDEDNEYYDEVADENGEMALCGKGNRNVSLSSELRDLTCLACLIKLLNGGSVMLVHAGIFDSIAADNGLTWEVNDID